MKKTKRRIKLNNRKQQKQYQTHMAKYPQYSLSRQDYDTYRNKQ